jgi:hypothetical protein
LGFARTCLNLFSRPHNALLLPYFSARAKRVGKVTPGTGYGTSRSPFLGNKFRVSAGINRVGKITPGTGYGTSKKPFLANNFRVGKFTFEAVKGITTQGSS